MKISVIKLTKIKKYIGIKALIYKKIFLKVCIFLF